MLLFYFPCLSDPGPELFTAVRNIRERRRSSALLCFLLQEPVPKVEVSDGMGRVDEGVEEFFTKKIIPDYAL